LTKFSGILLFTNGSISGRAASAKARPQRAALNRYPVPGWVHQRVYLHPWPKELVLRNHVQSRRGTLWSQEALASPFDW
jgi:hypothetical protein